MLLFDMVGGPFVKKLKVLEKKEKTLTNMMSVEFSSRGS